MNVLLVELSNAQAKVRRLEAEVNRIKTELLFLCDHCDAIETPLSIAAVRTILGDKPK